jgi:hypothetical protein
MTQSMMTILWPLLGFVLSLMVLSYILGDNPLFRIASYLLVGTAAGYLFVLVIYQVIIQRLILPLFFVNWNGPVLETILALLPVVLSFCLLLKLFQGGISSIGNIPLAYLVGVGAAVMITGVATATIFGQAQATVNLFGTVHITEAVLILCGTIATLAYFQFGLRPSSGGAGTKRHQAVEVLAKIGKVFIAITLGAVFAGVYLAALAALINRLDFLRVFIMNVLLLKGP